MRVRIAVTVAVATAVAVVVSGNHIDVRMNAAWQQTPLLAEASEAIAAFSPAAFWRFVDMTAPMAPELRRQLELDGEAPPDPTTSSPQIDQYARVLGLIPALILNEAQQKLARSEIASRAFSPKVSAHHDLALQALSTTSSSDACKDDGFLDFGEGRIICDVTKVVEAVESAELACHRPPHVALEDEHVLEAAAGVAASDPAAPKACSAEAVLYGSLGTKRTLELVAKSRELSKTGRLTTTFRHYFPNASAHEYPLGLQGYGVTVDVKSMEYKAVNEEDAKKEGTSAEAEKTIAPVNGVDVAALIKRFPALEQNLTAFSQKASKAVKNDLDLKVWETQKLSYQAAHKVLTSPKPMQTLIDLTENFPARIGAISRIPSDDRLEKTINSVTALEHRYGDGENRLWLNGRSVDSKHHDLFSLLAMLRDEESLSNRVLSALTGTESPQNDFAEQVVKLKQCPIQSPADSPKPKLWIDESVPLWVNDVAQDDTYAHLSKSVKTILRQGMYGQPNFARKNLLNVIYVIDPTRRADIEAFASIARIFQQGAAIRVGLVFSFSDELIDFAERVDRGEASSTEEPQHAGALLMAAALEGVSDSDDKSAAMDFLIRTVYSMGHEQQLSDRIVKAVAGAAGIVAVPTETTASFMRAWADKVKLLGMSTLPIAVFNGQVFSEDVDNAIYRGFQGAYEPVKQLVRDGKLTDKHKDPYGLIHEEAGAVQRYQPAIFDEVKFQEWTSPTHQTLLERTTWLFASGYDYQTCDVTHVLTVNASTMAGLEDVMKALDFMANCKSALCLTTRLGIVAADRSRAAEILTALLHTAASMSEKKRVAFVKTFLKRLLDELVTERKLQDATAVNTAVYTLFNDLSDKYRKIVEWSPDYELSLNNHAVKTVTPAGATHKGSFVHTNGRITRVDATFLSDDFITLSRQEREQRGEALAQCVSDLDFVSFANGKVSGEDVTSEFISNKIVAIGSILASAVVKMGSRADKYRLPHPDDLYGFETGVPSKSARHSMIVVLDPISRPAQRLVSLVHYLTTHLNVTARVSMNPAKNVQKVPIKNYYRFVATPDIHFEGPNVATPKAIVRGLPTNVVLTLGIEDPDSWMVFATVAENDLDNLKLTPTEAVQAEYTLQSLVVTGSCTDINRMQPPRGLPLELTDAYGTRDTLVMSNYGYFQLQALPGVGRLAVQDGRASDIFRIESINGDVSTMIAVTSFRGADADVRVVRHEGQEMTELLAEDDKAGKASSRGGMFGGLFGNSRDTEGAWPPATTGDQPERPSKPTLNIFSLASGHLYERFLRIMMHTVMQTSSDVHGKNTTRIKFWLIENPMSPRFKRLLPHLAAKYGFEYGLVKYKWPHWLTRQTEKQRMIWAYKVLFLDVLFPLDTEKIIFVDADQIVRSDLHELYHFPLDGAPVAYTPFCQKARREETKGFRFWDSGFWADHLQSRPYHISAIYVVDLIRLRQIAAGDRYRMIYDNLAKDPNSLSNLDQDLPNFAQHQIPIKSLPEEWLWCETWCNDESKAAAKTIDLCNNPQTKAPKLDNAKRIIPEWEAMDAELQAFEDKVLGDDDATAETGADDAAATKDEL